MKVTLDSEGNKIEVGDFVRVIGEGCEAFKIEVIGKRGVVVNGCWEGIYKIIKLNSEEYEISEHIVYYWREK